MPVQAVRKRYTPETLPYEAFSSDDAAPRSRAILIGFKDGEDLRYKLLQAALRAFEPQGDSFPLCGQETDLKATGLIYRVEYIEVAYCLFDLCPPQCWSK